ncbi:hypothetical protein AAVH_17160 [Aphelenchoides avenae]|nr:hypothetical protein AAVH_17158 [Aphelenchus avenae]KAH7715454.1 hypothetical protein AAVH_17160 [Aphelenchus avenae]
MSSNNDSNVKVAWAICACIGVTLAIGTIALLFFAFSGGHYGHGVGYGPGYGPYFGGGYETVGGYGSNYWHISPFLIVMLVGGVLTLICCGGAIAAIIFRSGNSRERAPEPRWNV